jgi:hypothetical protein
MSMSDGGPAYPVSYEKYEPGVGKVWQDHPGMSLRDYFAAKAMQAALANDPGLDRTNMEIALSAYATADAMLVIRKEAAQS